MTLLIVFLATSKGPKINKNYVSKYGYCVFFLVGSLMKEFEEEKCNTTVLNELSEFRTSEIQVMPKTERCPVWISDRNLCD